MSMSGKLGDLSKRQTTGLQELKARLGDIWLKDFDSDVYLLRWLRARDFNVSAAEDMLRDHVRWRQDEDIDRRYASYNPPEVLKKFYPGGFCGRDREGYPVFIFPFGHVDPKQLFQAATFSELRWNRIFRFEFAMQTLIPQATEEIGKPIDGLTVIVDLEKFGMRNLWRPAMKEFNDGTKVLEANYPEIMHRIIIINNPHIFYIAYNLVKPFMSTTTEMKIAFLGYNYQEELLKLISADQLPVCYGGTLRDSNGEADCREWICWGGDIPETYYRKMEKTEAAVEITVARGASLSLDYFADIPGNLLQWEFETCEHDIKFGVFQRSGDSLAPVVPTEHVASHLTPVKGEVLLKEAGIYVVIFDNSYSWTRAKKLTYRVEMSKVYMEGDNLVDDIPEYKYVL